MRVELLVPSELQRSPELQELARAAALRKIAHATLSHGEWNSA